jgi:hypothetical protein
MLAGEDGAGGCPCPQRADRPHRSGGPRWSDKIPGPAGRPPRNHAFRLQEFMKGQVHSSVPRPRSASAAEQGGSDKPAYYRPFHHQRITPCHPYYPYPPILEDFACKQDLTHVRIAEQ